MCKSLFSIFIPIDLFYFSSFFFKQQSQISNCAVFILYKYVNLTVGNTWKHNVAFVSAVLFLQLIKRLDPIKEWWGRGASKL